jgi:Flp pilus assembly protein TadB
VDWTGSLLGALGLAAAVAGALVASLQGLAARRDDKAIRIEVARSAAELQQILAEFEEDEERRAESLEQLASDGDAGQPRAVRIEEEASQALVDSLTSRVETLQGQAQTETPKRWWNRLPPVVPILTAGIGAVVAVVSWLGVSPVFPVEKECLEFTNSVRDTYIALDRDARRTEEYYGAAALSSYTGEWWAPGRDARW